jgi:DNA-binding PadR family transcriptional regulator
MKDELDRDLTTLEYLVLGLISLEPQSGYTIINTFESDRFRWSASPGSIYPILKRLEKQGILSSELEMIHETRPRKMYSLTPLGETMLDDWLRKPLARREIVADREMVMMKFLFIEKRLSRQEVLAWLEAYEQDIDNYREMWWLRPDPETINELSVHHQLIIQAGILELEMQREWIQMARRRLESEANGVAKS